MGSFGGSNIERVNFADFDALSFDCYGTLIDWEAGIASVLRPWVDAHGSMLSDEELLVAYSVHEAEAEIAAPTDLYPQILARSMRSLGAALRIPVSDAEADAFGMSVPDWPAFPDSADALARLGRRYKLIILSNVDRTSFAGSNRRLGTTFASILTAEDVGSYKHATSWRFLSKRHGSAFLRESSCTWRRASSTITSRPRPRDYLPCGSIAATENLDLALRRTPRSVSHPIGRSRRWLRLLKPFRPTPAECRGMPWHQGPQHIDQAPCRP